MNKRLFSFLSALVFCLLPTHAIEASDSLNDKGVRDFAVTGGYYFDAFKEPYNRLWQIYSVGAEAKAPFGPVALTINMGKMQSGNPSVQHPGEAQILFEAYPAITEKVYTYFSYAYSPGRYFPTNRAHIQIWHNHNHGWVSSAGFAWYHFRSGVLIPNVGVEKYSGTWWFSSKAHLYFKESGFSTSLFLTARKYFSDYNYLQLTIGTGTAPDEPWDLLTFLEREKATSIRLLYHETAPSGLSIKPMIGFITEGYTTTVTGIRNRIEGGLTISYLLKGSR